MDQLTTGVNPFRPGAGATPPLLAGRERELAVADRKLGELASGRAPPRGLLLYGPRGHGKTVLLGEIARRSHAQGLRAGIVPPSAFRDRETLARRLALLVEATAPRLTGVQLGPVGAQVESVARPEDPPELFLKWVKEPGGPLVVLVDEAQTLSVDAGQVFLDAIQLAADEELPFLLVLAGTPDAPRRLRQIRTNSERAFRRLRIGRLHRSDTRRALEEPALRAGRPFTPSGVRLLARRSQDYPFFVQLLGSAAWAAAERAGHGGIGESSVREAIASAREELQTFYLERFQEARSRGVERLLQPLALAMRQSARRLSDEGIRSLLRSAAPRGTDESRARMIETLSDLGVLWETPDGGWEMGIPSFGDYVLDRDARAQQS